MSLPTLERPPLAASLPATPDDPRAQLARTRLQQLFRHSLRAGLIDPLLHIVLRQRQEECR